VIQGPNARDQIAPYAFYSFFVEAQGNASYIQLTSDNSNPLGKSKTVRVIGSSKQITGNKEISKWMGRKCKYHAHFTSRAARNKDWYAGMDTDLNWSDQKVKPKNWHGCFELNSVFRTSVDCCHVLKTWLELTRVRLYIEVIWRET